MGLIRPPGRRLTAIRGRATSLGWGRSCAEAIEIEQDVGDNSVTNDPSGRGAIAVGGRRAGTTGIEFADLLGDRPVNRAGAGLALTRAGLVRPPVTSPTSSTARGRGRIELTARPSPYPKPGDSAGSCSRPIEDADHVGLFPATAAREVVVPQYGWRRSSDVRYTAVVRGAMWSPMMAGVIAMGERLGCPSWRVAGAVNGREALWSSAEGRSTGPSSS